LQYHIASGWEVSELFHSLGQSGRFPVHLVAAKGQLKANRNKGGRADAKYSYELAAADDLF
jgi:hypothetical protein